MTSEDKKKIVITGGFGFIGHHFVEHVHKNTDWDIVILDKLSYASMGLSRNRDNLLLYSPRVSVFTIDLCSGISNGVAKEIGDVHYIVHMAADTHVDKSIENPVSVINNNVSSTVQLLEWARTLKTLKTFFYFSTDEVFGPAPGTTMYKEWDRHRPTNPYSASKSAAENICIAYENTYKLPLMVVNVMNAFGERQHVEKFIPHCIKNILLGNTINIHSYPGNEVSGSRFYIHAQNIANACLFLIEKGTIGEKYNISGEMEVTNLEIAQFVAKTLNKPLDYNMVDFHNTRPGHDLRYGLDGTKLKELGWNPKFTFYETLKKTINWTVKNQKWLEE